MVETTPNKAPRKPSARSRVTNGKLGDMDGRGKWARRLADLIQLYSSDLSSDPDSLPHSAQSLVRRAATLTVELERAETGYAQAGQAKAADLEAYQRTTNTLARLLGSLQAKVGMIEPIRRPGAYEPTSYDGGIYLRRARALPRLDPTESFTTSDWRQCHGDLIPPHTDRHLARAVAYVIARAVNDGTPVPTQFEQIATALGYEVDTESDGKVIALDDFRHREQVVE